LSDASLNAGKVLSLSVTSFQELMFVARHESPEAASVRRGGSAELAFNHSGEVFHEDQAP
jgi:hypothetical protein